MTTAFTDDHLLTIVEGNAIWPVQASDSPTGWPSCLGSGYTVTVKGLSLSLT